MINCCSNNELYSFHPGGVNALFTDGSVHFLKESMDPRIVVSLITRAGGEIVSADQYLMTRCIGSEAMTPPRSAPPEAIGCSATPR